MCVSVHVCVYTHVNCECVRVLYRSQGLLHLSRRNCRASIRWQLSSKNIFLATPSASGRFELDHIKLKEYVVWFAEGITKPAIRRLARRGGVKRISSLIYSEVRAALMVFLRDVIQRAVTYTEHAHRKTVSAMDVVYALRLNGQFLYGFEHVDKRGRRWGGEET